MRLFLRLCGGLVIAILFTVAVTVVIRLPSQHVPWGPVDLRAPTGLFTGYKLAALRNNPQACQNALHRAGIDFRSLPDLTENTACPRTNMIVLDRSRYPYSATVRGQCALLAALAVWEREAVAVAATRHLDSPVAQIQHLGIFSCRNIRGSSTRRSQHASANAIDIQGFTLENGRTITLQSDWGADTPAGRFLTAVRDQSCPLFRGVLGPDYNALHADHFHLDMGPYNICR